MRKFVDEILCGFRGSLLEASNYSPRTDPDAQAREADGKRISQSVVDAMTAKELHAMRLGPGKHLKGRTLFGGLVKPEEVGDPGSFIVIRRLTAQSLTISTS